MQRILRKRNIIERINTTYILNDFASYSAFEKEQLVQLCDLKIKEYIEKRGNAIWEHRRKNRKPISGSVRYEVLKRAKFRCELCGVHDVEKALEVDHIIPKNSGGVDSPNNYQALCFSCNASKRDTDSTDFRENHSFYDCRTSGCVFCEIEESRIIFQNNLAVWIYDKYPVTDKHSLIIPKRHFANYFDITQAEINAVFQLSKYASEELLKKDKSIRGFNIGNNSGLCAGQTVNHFHTHVIPRRTDDSDHPTGGIRKVVNGNGQY